MWTVLLIALQFINFSLSCNLKKIVVNTYVPNGNITIKPEVTPAPSANSTTVLPPIAAVDPKEVPYNATAPDAKESNDAPKRLFQGPPKPRGARLRMMPMYRGFFGGDSFGLRQGKGKGPMWNVPWGDCLCGIVNMNSLPADGRAPWDVEVYVNGQNSCSGVLLNKQYVMTAASCVCNGAGKSGLIDCNAPLVGGKNRRADGKTLGGKIGVRMGPIGRQQNNNVDYVMVSGKYNPATDNENSVNDIAIIKINGDLYPGDGITSNRGGYSVLPICFPRMDMINMWTNNGVEGKNIRRPGKCPGKAGQAIYTTYSNRGKGKLAFLTGSTSKSSATSCPPLTGKIGKTGNSDFNTKTISNWDFINQVAFSSPSCEKRGTTPKSNASVTSIQPKSNMTTCYFKYVTMTSLVPRTPPGPIWVFYTICSIVPATTTPNPAPTKFQIMMVMVTWYASSPRYSCYPVTEVVTALRKTRCTEVETCVTVTKRAPTTHLICVPTVACIAVFEPGVETTCNIPYTMMHYPPKDGVTKPPNKTKKTKPPKATTPKGKPSKKPSKPPTNPSTSNLSTAEPEREGLRITGADGKELPGNMTVMPLRRDQRND